MLSSLATRQIGTGKGESGVEKVQEEVEMPFDQV